MARFSGNIFGAENMENENEIKKCIIAKNNLKYGGNMSLNMSMFPIINNLGIHKNE